MIIEKSRAVANSCRSIINFKIYIFMSKKKIIRSEYKVWVEIERRDIYDNGDEDYFPEDGTAQGICIRNNLEKAEEKVEEIVNQFFE